MHLIKVNAINSTNSLAREMFRENPRMAASCIVAEEQLEGRGQRGTSWNSHRGQNLTFSILWPDPNISLVRQFLLSAVVSTGILHSLKKFNVPKLKVKWPNDIMAANYKVAGILIENVVADGKIAASILGVGLNVNQTDFDGLPSAGSLKLLTGQNFSREEVLDAVLTSLESALTQMEDLNSEEILRKYESHLFRIGQPSTFQLPDLTMFPGIIEGVSPEGKLRVRTEDGEELQEFDLKEIKLCF